MVLLPSVVTAQYRGGYRIHLVFKDGSEGTVNFRPWLKGPVFEPLRDLDHFRRFFVDGGTVSWPNGADVAPESLYEAAVGTRPNRRLQRAKARPTSRAKPRRSRPPRLRR
jgi:hypothetical protein